MTITLVKKILKDGSPCPKCQQVEERLIKTDQMSRIDQVLIADERDPDSAGMKLAERLNVERAPFFVVDEDGEQRVYTVYFKFVKEVLGQASSKTDEAREILRDNPDLDFI